MNHNYSRTTQLPGGGTRTVSHSSYRYSSNDRDHPTGNRGFGGSKINSWDSGLSDRGYSDFGSRFDRDVKDKFDRGSGDRPSDNKTNFNSSNFSIAKSDNKNDFFRRTGSDKTGGAFDVSDQNYEELKKECLRNGTLFEDPSFHADDRSLFFSQPTPRKFVWKRPGEITGNPKMFVGGASRFDVAQGMLGDCWFLAAIGALTQEECLMNKVIPRDQDFDKDYCGIFRFRFWQYGKWKEVVVDDKLPTHNNQLVFTRSTKGDEFWSALLEKAYAKLNGSYEALRGGQTSEAMEDFTGGLCQTFECKEAPKNIFDIMLRAAKFKSLMCAAIDASSASEIEAKLPNGLVKGHAYTVSRVARVNARGRRGQVRVDLVRVRNPWGNEREWNGAWSDGSNEWSLLSDAEKKNLGITFDHDGEFWISIQDFLSNFTKLEICMLSDEKLAEEITGRRWESMQHEGKWQTFVSAGGCRNHPDTFHTNPQYRITLQDPDDDNEVDNCQFVVGLLQKERRKMKVFGQQNLTIGFAIYKVEPDSKQYITNNRLNKEFFLYNKMTAKSDTFVNSREIVGRFSLPPGEYAVVPSTFYPHEEGSFLLRLFSEKPQTSKKIDTTTNIDHTTPTSPVKDRSKWIDDTLRRIFDRIAGRDEELDAFELRQAMNAAFREEYGVTEEFGLEASSGCLLIPEVHKFYEGEVNHK